MTLPLDFCVDSPLDGPSPAARQEWEPIMLPPAPPEFPTLPAPPDEVPAGWGAPPWRALALELESLTGDPLASWSDVRTVARRLGRLARQP